MLVHKFFDIRGRIAYDVLVYRFLNHIEYKIINSINDDIVNVIRVNTINFSNFKNEELEKRYLEAVA